MCANGQCRKSQTIHNRTQVVCLPLHPVPLRLVVGIVLGGLTSQLEVVEAFEGNGARADVVALVTELSHSLDDAPVDAEYVADAVGEGNLSRGRFEM